MDRDMKRQPLIKFLIKMCDFRWDLDIKDGIFELYSDKASFCHCVRGYLGKLA